MARKIIHIDMDAFYASVEQRDFPELRGKPVVVGGRPDSRGVVAAASYEARRFGIHSAMPASQAYRRCPDAVFVKPRFSVYREVSAQIRSVFFEYTDLVEPLSLDEAYLDVTANKKGIPSATWTAQEIRGRIWETVHLTASAGVAPNKFVAKVASDVNKPNGICVVPPDRVQAFIDALPIGEFHGIGKATEKRMHAIGVYTGADLRAREELELVRHFGKAGTYYHRIARGEDDREVSPKRTRKSVGVENTFHQDVTTLADKLRIIEELADELGRRMDKAGVAGKTVTVKLRFPDFETHTRAQSFKRFLADPAQIARAASLLLRQSEAAERPVRLLGITVSNLNNQAPEETGQVQLWLPFGEGW